MEKSHLGLEAFICPITGVKHTFGGGILIDRRLKKSLERENVVGTKLSEECQKMVDDGFVGLVEIDERKSDIMPNGNYSPEGAYRTGRVAWIKLDVFSKVFDSEPPKQFCYVGSGVIDKINKMAK